MAFQFPDPNVTPEFTGDNGMTYAWDPVGSKWVIKGFPNDPGDLYVEKTGDTMTGALLHMQVDGNGDEVPQVIGELADEATSTHKKYVDDKDETLRQQIIELGEELEGLAPSLVRGSWKYSEDFTKPVGEFGARTSQGGIPTDWDNITKLIFNKEDSTGVEHSFSDIEDGTYFQIFEQGSETAAMYQATAVATINGDQVEIPVNHVQSVADTSAIVGELYRFKIFQLNDDSVDVTGFLKKTSDTIGKGGGNYSHNPDTTYKVKLKNKSGWPDDSPALLFQGDPSNYYIYGTYVRINDLGFAVAGNTDGNHKPNGNSNLSFVINNGRSGSDGHSVRRWGTIYDSNTDEVADVGYVNRNLIRAAAIPTQQVDWANQTYSSGIWILQDDPGAGDPDIQRFMLSDAQFADVRDSSQVKYISVHALGGGDFINYQNENVGDLIQVYGSPIPKVYSTESPERPDDAADLSDARRMELREESDRLAFGIYEIEAITEHNFPDNIEGGNFTDAFVTYTVKPLATANDFLTDDMCIIKTMPDPVKTQGQYLPLTGGTLSGPGNLNVEGQLKVSTGSEFKVQYSDDTSMVRVQPDQNSIILKAGTINTKNSLGSLNDRAGLEIQVSGEKPLAISNSGSYQSTLEIYGYDGDSPGGRKRNLFITAGGNINLDGNVNAQSFVKGSELRSTKLTSGQSSNLQIYRGSGDNEERKMLIGTDSVNFDVNIKMVGPAGERDFLVQNGTNFKVDNNTLINFGGSGAFYKGVITHDEHFVNKAYVDDVVEDLEQQIDQASKGRVKLGEFILRTTTGQPTGNSLAGELTLWHLEPGATTTPVNEFKLRPTDDAEYSSKGIYDLLAELFEGRPYVVVLKQDDKEIRLVGKDQGWLTDSERTFHLSATEYDGDTLTGAEVVELFAEVSIDSALDDFYLKSGGDIHGFVRIVKPDGVLLGTRPNDSADNLFQVWADGTVDLKHELKFNGTSKKIKSGNTELFDFEGNNVRIPRRGDNSIGFQLKGKAYTADENLLNVYHRPDYDEIMYRGKIDDPYAIVTKSWVEQNAGGFTPGNTVAATSSAGVQVGGFYLQNGNVFCKIS